ncbi:hypothetical protein INR49_029256 [Caranx melampygus]|nr:hypothetical protein INR49_029256 [Caranx melampygus]
MFAFAGARRPVCPRFVSSVEYQISAFEPRKPNTVVKVILITTPTIMYLGFAMHKIARMDDTEYRPVGTRKKKKMPIVSRGAVRDYEEAEDNGEEDPMIAEEIEPDKPDKADKSRAAKLTQI